MRLESRCSALASAEVWQLPFGPLFLELFCMMVRSGLARLHVQPCPRKNFPLSFRAERGICSDLFELQIPRSARDDKVERVILGSGTVVIFWIHRACSSGG